MVSPPTFYPVLYKDFPTYILTLYCVNISPPIFYPYIVERFPHLHFTPILYKDFPTYILPLYCIKISHVPQFQNLRNI